MKRLLTLLLCLLLLCGCSKAAANRYASGVFEAELPESFEPVKNAGVLCFAPYGDPLRSSSITFYSTELNWYFDTFTQDEYETALQTLTGYESLSVVDMQSCRVDGNDARRIACKAAIDQGTHDLILYAISADQLYFFVLLNRDTDSYVDAFDAMMQSLKLKGMP